jgi:hypothetical protein
LRLAILAPDTDAAGARLLVARLQRELDYASQNKTIAGQVRLRVGYSAVSDLAASKINVPNWCIEQGALFSRALTRQDYSMTNSIVAATTLFRW